MIVYVITQGSYSDYHICAVVTDKEKAKALQNLFSTDYEEAMIEIYDTEEPKIESFDNPLWEITFRGNGEIHGVHDEEWCPSNYEQIDEIGDTMFVYVRAVDEEHAIKIATDRRAKYLAEKEGL